MTKTLTDQFGNSYLATCEPLNFHLLGVQYTASGYGNRIPTEWVVTDEGRRKRVYAICYSNTSTLYFKRRGIKVTVS